MKSLSQWSLLGFILEYLSIKNLTLPISPHEVFQSDQWLFGNIASLSAFININISNNDINNNNNNNNNNIDSNNKNNNENIMGNDQIFPKNNQDNENISDEILIIYLQLLIYLYCHCDVPGIVQGKKGIVWKKKVNFSYFFQSSKMLL